MPHPSPPAPTASAAAAVPARSLGHIASDWEWPDLVATPATCGMTHELAHRPIRRPLTRSCLDNHTRRRHSHTESFWNLGDSPCHPELAKDLTNRCDNL